MAGIWSFHQGWRIWLSWPSHDSEIIYWLLRQIWEDDDGDNDGDYEDHEGSHSTNTLKQRVFIMLSVWLHLVFIVPVRQTTLWFSFCSWRKLRCREAQSFACITQLADDTAGICSQAIWIQKNLCCLSRHYAVACYKSRIRARIVQDQKFSFLMAEQCQWIIEFFCLWSSSVNGDTTR